LIIKTPESTTAIFISLGIFTLLLIPSILIWKKVNWLRYLFLILIPFGLMSFIVNIKLHLDEPLWGLINLMIVMLQLYALLLLFQPFKKKLSQE
jgi:hypothetical protein